MTSISILMPCYNAGRWLSAAVQSGMAQLKDGDELVLQDGCSTDGAVEAVQAQWAGDSRLRVVSEKDDGQADALNRALARARGDAVGWLNADDLYFDGALDAAREGMAAGADLVIGRYTVFDAAGRTMRTYDPGAVGRRKLLKRGCYAFSGATFYDIQLLRQAGGFDRDLHYCMDFELLLRLTDQPLHIEYTHSVLGGLRWHDASKSGTAGWSFIREASAIRREHVRSVGDRVAAIQGGAVHRLSDLTTPIRHSRAYSAVRRNKRFR